MDLTIILIITFAYWLISSLETWLAYPMIDAPLVLGAVIGAILGDLTQGVIIGATLQLIFLGVMGIGGTLPQDAAIGTVIGTAFAISLGQSTEVALTFAVPISIAGSFLNLSTYILKGFLNPMVEKFAKEGNYKAIEWSHRLIAFGHAIPKTIALFITLYVGNQFAQSIVDTIPEIVIAGMDFASDMMPAVGIALLLRVMWTNKMSVYYFLGIALVLFFNLNMLGVAVSGVILAIIILLEFGGNSKTGTQINTKEEGLFND